MFTHLSAFDLDHTLFKINSSYRFGSYLYQKNCFSFSTMLSLVGNYALHKIGISSLEKMHHKSFEKIFYGNKLDYFRDHVRTFLDLYWQEFIYPPVFQKLHEAKQRNHYTAIFSSSPDFLVALIAERLEVEEWQATRYEIDKDQAFCKISRIMDGKLKADSLTLLAEKLKLSKNAITAYSDSILDRHFLLAAGQAVGVNPDRELRVLCRQNEWTVL